MDPVVDSDKVRIQVELEDHPLWQLSVLQRLRLQVEQDNLVAEKNEVGLPAQMECVIAQLRLGEDLLICAGAEEFR